MSQTRRNPTCIASTWGTNCILLDTFRCTSPLWPICWDTYCKYFVDRWIIRKSWITSITNRNIMYLNQLNGYLRGEKNNSVHLYMWDAASPLWLCQDSLHTNTSQGRDKTFISWLWMSFAVSVLHRDSWVQERLDCLGDSSLIKDLNSDGRSIDGWLMIAENFFNSQDISLLYIVSRCYCSPWVIILDCEVFWYLKFMIKCNSWYIPSHCFAPYL